MHWYILFIISYWSIFVYNTCTLVYLL